MGFKETFKALAEPVRREILELLAKHDMSAGEIVDSFDLTGATISYHLSVLSKAGLVDHYKEKNNIYYVLNTSVVEEGLLFFSNLLETSKESKNEAEIIKES